MSARTLLLAAAACAVLGGAVTEVTAADAAARPAAPKIPPSVRLGKCKLTLGTPYLWRDFMPIVAKPGPDGGSPLYTTCELVIDNSAGAKAVRFSWSAVVRDEAGKEHPLAVQGKKAVVPAHKTSRIRIVDRNGPYLKAGSTCTLILKIVTPGGKVHRLRAKPTPIQATH